MMVFDKQWFQKYQRFLLWFANTRYGRDVLCINGHRSSLDGLKIDKITPNSVRARIGDSQFVEEFRTAPKFSRRLYHSYRHIWKAFHWWDMHVANIWMPQMNLGFDTLTVYPDADPEENSVDGSVEVITNDTWANIVSANGTHHSDTRATERVCSFTASGAGVDLWFSLYRSIFLFDTKLLGTGSTISSAVISLAGHQKQTESDTPDINIYSSNPASNTGLQNSDFQTIGSTAFSDTISYADWSLGSYNDFDLNSSGISNINKNGVSKFGGRDATHDAGGVAPTWAEDNASNYMTYRTSDYSGSSSDPKLVVVYTPGTPDVSSVEIRNIKKNSIEFIYRLNYAGSGMKSGAVYATSPNPTKSDNVVSVSGTFYLGEYSVVVDNLTSNTLYYVRAFATNSTATTYGSNIIFRTRPNSINIQDGQG